MIPVVSVDVMRQSDAATIRAMGGDSRALMERAGRAIFEAAEWKPPVAVVCGVGNNAGDGFVVASLLQQRGIPCRIFLLRDRFSADGRYFYDRCLSCGVPVSMLTEDTDFSRFGSIADCLFGTGFSGPAQGLAARVIEQINASGAYVVSADINSGLSGDTGLGTPCVHSDLTVSIGFLKAGHVINCAKDVIGRLTNANIGITLVGDAVGLAQDEDVRSAFAPRLCNSHKGTYGTAALIGGCLAYSGAAKLANLSLCALRAGCGISRLCVPKTIAHAVAPYLLESTLCPMLDHDGFLAFDPDSLDEALHGASSAAVGMGLGRFPDAGRVVEYLLTHFKGRMVLDADGLNALSALGADTLLRRTCDLILTPHPKEFERLSGIPAAEAIAHPASSAAAFARRYGVTVLLKGTATTISDGKDTFFCNRGGPGMATAGSGDVLSGILCGLLSHSPESCVRVALCGAYLNGLSGELAQQECGAVSMVASDTARHLPAAVRLLTADPA